MKKNLMIFIPMLALSAASCNKDVDEGTVWDDPNFIRITVNSEQLYEQVALKWSVEDTLAVFDNDGAVAKLGTNDDPASSAVFFSNEWTAGTPEYVVYTSSRKFEDINRVSPGVFGMELEDEQILEAAQSYAGNTLLSVGKVDGNNSSYKVDPMKNITAFIKVKFSGNTVKSVKIEAVGGEPVGGRFNLDCAGLESGGDGFCKAAEGKNPSPVTIRPAEGSKIITGDGCFKAGEYYMAILPQKYSQGLRLTVSKNDGTVLEHIYGNSEDGLAVKRNTISSYVNALDTEPPVIIPQDKDNYMDVIESEW